MPILCICFFSTMLHFALLYSGIVRIPAATSAVIYQLTPLLTIILASFFLKETVSIFVITGFIISFTEIIYLFGKPDLLVNANGGWFILMASFSFAVGTILIKKFGPFNTISLNAWSALLSAPVMLFMSYLTEPLSSSMLWHITTISWIVIFYADLSGGVIGFMLWYYILNKYPVSKVAPYTLLTPLFAVAVAQVFLAEKLTSSFYASAFLIILGVAIAQFNLLGKFPTNRRNS